MGNSASISVGSFRQYIWPCTLGFLVIYHFRLDGTLLCTRSMIQGQTLPQSITRSRRNHIVRPPHSYTPISDVVCPDDGSMHVRRHLQATAAHKRIRLGTSSGSAPFLIPILHIAYPNRPQARRTSPSQLSNLLWQVLSSSCDLRRSLVVRDMMMQPDASRETGVVRMSVRTRLHRHAGANSSVLSDVNPDMC